MMFIRRIQLKNSFYMDKNYRVEDARRNEPMGQYCTFGYFDALTIDKEPWGHKDAGEQRRPGAWTVLSEGIINEMDGRCSVRNLLCVSVDQDKDDNFWKMDESTYPFLFVSVIRIKDSGDNDTIETGMCELNGRETSIAYFSYEHSELVVLYKTNEYSDGHRFSEELHEILGIHKMYTIFSVKESILQSYNVIKNAIIEEKVDCRLRAIVKDWSLVSIMKSELEAALTLEDEGAPVVVVQRHMLGNADVLFEADNISLCRLLACYKTGRLLTHSGELYERAFYNIETEILKRK